MHDVNSLKAREIIKKISLGSLVYKVTTQILFFLK